MSNVYKVGLPVRRLRWCLKIVLQCGLGYLSSRVLI